MDRGACYRYSFRYNLHTPAKNIKYQKKTQLKVLLMNHEFHSALHFSVIFPLQTLELQSLVGAG